MATPDDAPTDDDERRQVFWDQASHDLRQPVQSLQLLARVFARHADSSPTREAAAHMRGVVEDIARMHEALVQLSRLECGRTPPDRQPVALNELVTNIVGELAAAARDRHAELRTRSLEMSPETDAAWLGIILRALIHFTLRHCEGGDVVISGKSRKGAVSVVIDFRGPDVPAKEIAGVFLESTGPEQWHAVLGPGYLDRLCALLGYRLDFRAGKPGKPAFELAIPRNPRSA